jgi:imidazolonepropionase-like amidohydrolase
MEQMILRGGMVWDGHGDAAVRADVLVSEGKIEAVGEGFGGGRDIDASGLTIVPGLIEAHAHLCFDATPGWRATYDGDSSHRMLLRMASNGRKMLRAGITTVRDLGAPTELAIELRNAVASGMTEGPRLIVAGAPVTTTGGHCWFMGGECDGVEGMRKAVRERVKAGVDVIKVMASGGNMTPRTNPFEPQFTVEELSAGVAEAHRLNRKVTAHAHGIAGVRVAVEAGVDCIEHCSFTVPGGYDFDKDLIRRIADDGIVVSPTVSIGYRRWPDDGLKKKRAEILSEMLASECRVVMSTDCGIPNVPHEALAAAMDVFAEATVSLPVDVLKLATSRSAELLELKDRGSIEPGKVADLVVVEGNPLENLMHLEKVRIVVKGGEVAGIVD